MAAETNVYIGTGRRKTSVARVRLTEGTGKVTVNGIDAADFFSHENFSRIALNALVVSDLKDKVDVKAVVSGGGNSGQAGAISLGISRALLRKDGELRPILKPVGLLTRDPRMKERKKSGQPGARKKFQFSKR